ncbi:MAG: hypothetical protein KatS3mg091_184 [Patescibacteria group bacterium]|nr:MAG: hypothetical protein KatS3mg091_184 [Patescibacteria group bacterium]
MAEQRLNQKTATDNLGFSLIELLTFILLISLILIAAAGLIITSIKNTKNTQYRALAEYYAKSLENWLTNERYKSWSDFQAKTGSNNGSSSSRNYCFNTETVSNWPAVGSCNNNYSLSGRYKRDLVLSYDSATKKITANITVTWKGISGNDTVNIKRDYSRFEY